MATADTIIFLYLLFLIRFSFTSSSQSNCKDGFFICIDMDDCNSLPFTSNAISANEYYISPEYLDGTIISTDCNILQVSPSSFNSTILTSNILDPFATQKSNTQFAKCEGYVNSVGSSSFQITNERTVSNPIYFKYLFLSKGSPSVTASKKHLMIVSWDRRSNNSFARNISNVTPNKYCVLERNTTYTYVNISQFQIEGPNIGEKDFQISLIEGKFTMKLTDLLNIDSNAYDMNKNPTFSLFIRFFVYIYEQKQNYSSCDNETNQYLYIPLLFLDNKNSIFHGWAGICISKRAEILISVYYGQDQKIILKLRNNLNQMWNEVTLVFNNDPPIASVMANMTTITVYGDRIAQSEKISLLNNSYSVKKILIADVTSSSMEGYLQSDLNVFFAINFIGFYNGNLSEKINTYFDAYQNITSQETFSYPLFIDGPILQPVPVEIAEIHNFLSGKIETNPTIENYFPDSFGGLDICLSTQISYSSYQCGTSYMYCEFCAKANSNSCIQKCKTSSSNGNRRIGAFVNHCYCKVGYASLTSGGECLPLQCNPRCSSGMCYGTSDTQCYGPCNTDAVNVLNRSNNDFFFSTSCECKEHTLPYMADEKVCYFSFNCARSCKSYCIETTDICKSPCIAEEKCIGGCSENSYGIDNQLISNINIPLWNCSCLNGRRISSKFPESCVFKDEPSKKECHPFCNGECLEKNDASQCFVYCISNNTMIYPKRNDPLNKLKTGCICKSGEIYTQSGTQICPYLPPECSQNCLSRCYLVHDSSQCYFNCAKKPFAVTINKQDSLFSCTCQSGFKETSYGCVGIITKKYVESRKIMGTSNAILLILMIQDAIKIALQNSGFIVYIMD